jgi:hypothetical protein
MNTKQPMQPIVKTESGTVRFKTNEIVDYILTNGGIDMNDIAYKSFTQEDRMQFAQLIGYSVSGFGDLSYADPGVVAIAERIAQDVYNDVKVEETSTEIELEYYKTAYNELKDALRAPMSELFGIHPDDLH